MKHRQEEMLQNFICLLLFIGHSKGMRDNVARIYTYIPPKLTI